MAKKNFLPGILAILLICTVLLAGCEFGGENNSEPDPGDGITALEPVGPLPAALVEADPMPGSELGVNAEITLYFNQPMNKPSVEAAVQISPAVSGDFTWLDDSTVSFSPASSWEPDTDLVLTITSAAKSADDQPLQQATSLAYHVADFLLLVQGLPVADIEDVDPTAAIVAAFNYPVVPLGASPESLFPAFTLVPEAEGKGEWINTSTYIFYPQPGLFGGQAYSVQLDPTLKSVDGTPLKDSTSWAFTTAQPALISFSPAPGEMQVRLDEEIKLVFNQPMDTESLEKGFVLRRGDGSAVLGSFEWNDSETRMLFIPDELYTRDQRYSVYIPSNASSKGGSVLTANIGNFSFFAARELFVTTTEPGSGGLKEYRRSVVINFNSPLEDDGNLEAYVSVDPVVDVRVSSDKNSLYVSGNFQPEEQYTVSVLPGISDIWGDPLDQTFQLNFRGAPLNPDFRVSIFSGAGVMFVNPENPGIAAQVVNIDQVEVLTANLPLQEFIYLDGEADYETKQNYQPAQPAIRTQNLDILPNRNQQVGVGLSASGDLPTGLYWVKLTPDPAPKFSQPQNFFAVVSHVHLVYKVGSSDALVWAMDTRSGEPAANAPVALYSEAGILLASGVTDHQGMFYSKISIEGDLYGSSYAVLNSPGDDQFSLATSVWDWGISAWDFGFRADFSPSEFEYYIYTDRPIYKPGDMVQYRVIARSAFFGRYQLPGEESILLSVRDHNNAELSSYTLPLSEHGTSSGAYYLSDGAQPGYYELRVGEPGNFSYLTFQVAEYRKPEIDLQVSFGQQEILAGEALDAEVLAEYFFDAPVSDVDTQWDLYIDDDYFYLPGYRVGPLRERSYNPWSSFYTGGLGIWSAGGEETTDGQGGFAVNLTSEATSRIQEYSFEVTVADESGMPVSSRASAIVHPAPIYIGLRSDLWVGQVDTEMGFDLKVVDWEKQNAGEQSVKAVFGKVSWERSGPNQFGSFSYEKVVTLISEGQLDTNGQGEARLTFIPETPGVYQLEVSSGEAITQMLIWVGGPGQTAWPSLEENQLTLIPDAETYQVGDTASIFIPNPFVGDAQVLVTVERGDILDQEVITISGSGLTYSLAIEELSVPNVYFTVAMIGETAKGTLDYYYGLTNFDVAVEKQVLNVVVAGDPERAYPGSPIEFTIQVTDNTGAPVEGEFSLSVVDEAVLALADPYEDPILEFFYGRQPLGVRTGISLLATSEDFLPDAGGLGGGGGDGSSPDTRSKFEDTAYWNAAIVTDADGTAQVEVILPDNLTAWRVQVRGVTKDTQVGEGVSEVITTKELLIRPVLPRFAVAGDHLRLGAVVHNNTDRAIQASMAFQVLGVALDDPNSALQEFEIPANGRTEVEWWGTVEAAVEIEAIFTVEGGGYSDITTQQNGVIPVFSYLAPQTFSTAGVLNEGGERLEVISLPSSFEPTSGGLKLEMTSSLAAVALEGMQALESYSTDSIEYTISRFLPNLEMLKAMQEFGLDAPELQAQLDAELRDIIRELEGKQNYNGGWGWNAYQNTSSSNPYVSAYALLGMVRAREMGYPIKEYKYDAAIQYLITYLVETEIQDDELWKYDRFAFIHFVLVEADAPMVDLITWLMAESDRLSPWAQALLAVAMDDVNPGNSQAATIFSNLQANAVRSASGAHWDNTGWGWQNMASDQFTNSVVIYALARYEPASPLIPDAVRYLMAYRDAEGGWRNSYTTAWALIALSEVMRGTGELGGEFAFSAELNNQVFADGEAGGVGQFVPVVAEVGIDQMVTVGPNALNIQRDPGTGRLYYRASLQVGQAVEDVEPLNRGLTISRAYYATGEACSAESCPAITSAQVGDLVTARVTLTLPNSMHYLEVKDYIPAGTEILNTNLKTSQQGVNYEDIEGPNYDPRDPFAGGWGWWYFGRQVVHDEYVSWNAEFLPAGTYELVYTLVVLQPGDFQVIPAQANQVYFPEVQGTSAGAVFEVVE